jgi:hypothetical protein
MPINGLPLVGMKTIGNGQELYYSMKNRKMDRYGIFPYLSN